MVVQIEPEGRSAATGDSDRVVLDEETVVLDTGRPRYLTIPTTGNVRGRIANSWIVADARASHSMGDVPRRGERRDGAPGGVSCVLFTVLFSFCTGLRLLGVVLIVAWGDDGDGFLTE